MFSVLARCIISAIHMRTHMRTYMLRRNPSNVTRRMVYQEFLAQKPYTLTQGRKPVGVRLV